MPSVSDIMNVFSHSSFDTWSVSREEADDASIASPVRYVREGEFDPKFDANQAKRHYEEKKRRRRLSDTNSLAESVQRRQEHFFEADFSSIDDDSRDSTLFSHSTARSRQSAHLSRASRNRGGIPPTNKRSQDAPGNPFADDSFDDSRNKIMPPISAGSPARSTDTSSRNATIGNLNVQNANGRKNAPENPFAENRLNSSRRNPIPPSNAGYPEISSDARSSRNISAEDSLDEVLDTSFDTEAPNLSSVIEDSSHLLEEEKKEYYTATSAEQMASLRRENRQMDQPRASPATIMDSHTLSSVSSLGGSASAEDGTGVTLHGLCSEAISTDDVAWRNALYLLSIQPDLATTTDEGGRTPLHLCCLSNEGPPEFLVRALLLCHSAGSRVTDKGGRLPLHMIAAASANPTIMKLIVDEYPQSVYKSDKGGFTPLHMFLMNNDVDLSMDQLRILLGQAVSKEVSPTNDRLLHRRGEHLDLKLDELNRRVNQQPGSTVALESLDKGAETDAEDDAFVNAYPEDVQLCFRKIAQWKRKKRRQNQETEESIEVELGSSVDGEETNAAAIPTPSTFQLPLHIVASRIFSDGILGDENDSVDVMNPPVPRQSEILRVLVSAYPEGLISRDSHGRTPLMVALLNQEQLPTLESVQLLLGIHTSGYEAPPAWADDIPLHRATTGRYTNPAMVPNFETNQLPLHIAAEEMPSYVSAIDAIYRSYPAAVNVQDVRGRTPLHMALRNYQSIQPDPAVVSLLLKDRVAQIRDGDGFLPFDLLVAGGHNLPYKEPQPSTWDSSNADPSKVYKKFFTSVVLQAPRPRNRNESMAFLERLRILPPWLRRQACTVGFVQEILLEEISSLLKCFLILSWGAMITVLLILFRLQMEEFTKELALTSWYAPVIYILSAVMLLIQVLHWFDCASLSVFTSQCALNIWRWVDLSALLITLVTTALVQEGASDEALVASLGTASTGLLWCSVLAYLGRWWHGMGVFLGGIGKISNLLFWPFATAGILIVAFAQMFYTSNLTTSQSDCRDSLAGQGLCNVRDSYITVYNLLLWTPLVGTEDESLNTSTIVLIAFFTALLILIILNMVISVVIEAAMLDLDEIALGSFWEPMLNFVWSTDWIEPASCCKRRGSEESGYIGTRKLLEEPSVGQRYSSSLERLWGVTVLAIEGGEKERGHMWYLGCFSTRKRAPHLIWPLRLLGLVAIPVWFVAGLATCGLLWPPQVRRWLFRPSRSKSIGSRSANAATEYSAQQVAAMRSELLNLKSMSYERSSDLQGEIRELKELIYSAMQEED